MQDKVRVSIIYFLKIDDPKVIPGTRFLVARLMKAEQAIEILKIEHTEIIPNGVVPKDKES